MCGVTINVASAYDIKGNDACCTCIKSQDRDSSQLTEGSESGLWSDSLVNAEGDLGRGTEVLLFSRRTTFHGLLP